MPSITASDRALLWACQDGAAIIETGSTQPGETTITGEWRLLINAADEPAFLAAVAGKAGDYNPLPGVGERVEAGIYGWQDGLVMVRQPHTRTEHAPEDVPALFIVWREDAADVLEWVANERVEVGTRRTDGGKTWQAIQAHVTQEDWQPAATPALWAEVVETTLGEWAVGVAYKAGDIVTYHGREYQCRQAHTSLVGWEPPNVLALWLPL